MELHRSRLQSRSLHLKALLLQLRSPGRHFTLSIKVVTASVTVVGVDGSFLFQMILHLNYRCLDLAELAEQRLVFAIGFVSLQPSDASFLVFQLLLGEIFDAPLVKVHVENGEDSNLGPVNGQYLGPKAEVLNSPALKVEELQATIAAVQFHEEVLFEMGYEDVLFD